MLKILLVEDDRDVREVVERSLREAHHEVSAASDGAVAVERLKSTVFDLVVTDVRLPKADGLAVFRHAKKQAPRTDVILMTSFGSTSDAVTAVKEGAYDYLTKPFEPEALLSRVRAVAEKKDLERQLDAARAALGGQSDEVLIGASPPMARLNDRVAAVAASDAPALVVGESGTGKEIVARQIHALSGRRAGPFVPVNCAAFPDTLLEAELFGHEKGAFTGAVRKRDGRFKAADGGTLLLDEIAEMPMAAQAKLLRVLEHGLVEPLGTNAAVRVDVRVVSATHRDLRKRIVEGHFREDLYYRLNGVSLEVPALRDRRADLPLLVQHFLRKYAPKGAPLPEVSVAAWQALSLYAFPGNVRELAHAVQHAVVLARGGPIDVLHLPEDIAHIAMRAAGERAVRPLAAVLRDAERECLLAALTFTDGKRMKAAELLGISRKNLWEKLKAHGISDSDLDD